MGEKIKLMSVGNKKRQNWQIQAIGLKRWRDTLRICTN